jgi:hypothetical protein
MAKLIFYILYLFNGLTLLFFIGLLFDNLTAHKAFTGKNENLIFIIAMLIIGVGIYFGHKLAFTQKNFALADIIFAGAWVLALIVIIIGLFLFNGPIHWN